MWKRNIFQISLVLYLLVRYIRCLKNVRLFFFQFKSIVQTKYMFNLKVINMSENLFNYLTDRSYVRTPNNINICMNIEKYLSFLPFAGHSPK